LLLRKSAKQWDTANWHELEFNGFDGWQGLKTAKMPPYGGIK
jgi:hypothetical protein